MVSQPQSGTPEPRITRNVGVAHILFMDIVAYSRLPMEQQPEVVRELQDVVQETPEYVSATSQHDLLGLPRGDGMALVFLRDALSPVRCALEIARELKKRPNLHLRMGIHSGPVYLVTDINDQRDVSGEGIVTAQRVMDCGDNGHILLSSTVAEYLSKLGAWSPYLIDLGICTVKHKVKVHVYNLVTRDVGNRTLPRKIFAEAAEVVERQRSRASSRKIGNAQSFEDALKLLVWIMAFLGMVFTALWFCSGAFRSFFHDAYAAAPPGPTAPRNDEGNSNNTPGATALDRRGPGSYYPPIAPERQENSGATSGPQNGQSPEITAVAPNPQMRSPSVRATLSRTGRPLDEWDGPPVSDADPGSNEQSEPQDVVVVVGIPRDGSGERTVRVDKVDATGVDSTGAEPHQEGDEIRKELQVYGERVTIRVYYNEGDQWVAEETFRLPKSP